MYCIEIMGIPPGGSAPPSIKTHWIGLRLPIYPNRYTGRPGPEFFAEIGCNGYPTPIDTALAILSLHHPEAVTWWLENTQFASSGGNLIFSEDCCRLVESLPSLNVPATGQVTVSELVQNLTNQEDTQEGIFLLKIRVGEGSWEELRQFPLSRAATIFIADLAQVALNDYLDGCSSEEQFQSIQTMGRRFFRAVYDFTQAHGVDVEWEMLDRPLSFVDVMLREGLIEEVEGGIAPSAKSKRLSQSINRSLNARNN